MTGIYDYMTMHMKEIQQDILTLVQKESPSIDRDAANQCKEAIQQLLMREFKQRAEEFPQQEHGSHLRFEYGDGAEQLLLVGHYDTVWKKGVFPIKQDGDKLYGPGILDMKSSIVMAVWAVKACRELEIGIPYKIVCIFNSDEEVGSKTSRELIKEEAKKSKVALVLEPPEASGALKTSRKGILSYDIEITGKAAHAGNAFTLGVSAIIEAAKQIEHLSHLTDLELGTTVNIGTIQGGSAKNVVPERVHLGVDVRVLTKHQQSHIERFFKQLKPTRKDITLTVTGGVDRPPMPRLDSTEHIFDETYAIAGELDYIVKQIAAGGGSDANFTSEFTPTLDGLGVIGEGMHASNEHIVLSEIPKRFALLAKLITELK